MTLKFFKTFEFDGVPDGTTVSNYFIADEDFKIKRIIITRKDGVIATRSVFYLKISERVYSREIIPAVIFDENAQRDIILDIPVRKGERIDFSLRNLEGGTQSFFVVFECTD